jgi:hypothetical protein
MIGTITELSCEHAAGLIHPKKFSPQRTIEKYIRSGGIELLSNAFPP